MSSTAQPESGNGASDHQGAAVVLTPPGRSGAITIRIEPELHERLRVTAAVRATTTQRLVVEALERFFAEPP